MLIAAEMLMMSILSFLLLLAFALAAEAKGSFQMTSRKASRQALKAAFSCG